MADLGFSPSTLHKAADMSMGYPGTMVKKLYMSNVSMFSVEKALKAVKNQTHLSAILNYAVAKLDPRGRNVG